MPELSFRPSVLALALLTAGAGLMGCAPDGARPIDPVMAPPRQNQPLSQGPEEIERPRGEIERPRGGPEQMQPVAVYRPGQNEPAVVLSRDTLVDFVLETRGLDALLNLMRLELARAEAESRGIEVTEADVQAEVNRTLRQAVPPDNDLTDAQLEQYLGELLARQQLSRAEFDVIMETNANLRAVAIPMAREMATDEALQETFRARYGQQVEIRVMAFRTMQDLTQAKARVESGEDFAKVASEVSEENVSAMRGGLLEPFTRTAGYPEPFKEAAFSLEPGQVSDAVEAEGAFWLIKQEKKIDPVAVKFEDVKDKLREQIAVQFADEVIDQQRQSISARLATEQLSIVDPVLAEQLKARLARLAPPERETGDIDAQLEAESAATTRSATRQAQTPASQPAMELEAATQEATPEATSEATTQPAQVIDK